MHLRAGQLDAAAAAAAPVLALPHGRRISELPQRFALTRRELASPVYRGAAEAATLDERIEAFLGDNIVADLRELPSAT
jgi:hypothetical protein